MDCKIRTDTTNLLEIDTARTSSARSSTLYQTPMRRMTTTGSKKGKKNDCNDVFTQDSLDYSQTICTLKRRVVLKVTTATTTPF